MAGSGAAPALLPVNMVDLTAKQLAYLLVAPPSHLLVDCGGLLLPHPLGVCRFVAQLLQLHLRGTCIWLCNVHPKLRRCLYGLQLDTVFHLNGEAQPTGTAPAGLEAGRMTLA